MPPCPPRPTGIKHLFFSLLWMAIPALYAQSWLTQVQEYGVEDGLSHRSVQCIVQDKKGFIWIGTEQGLNRFDGYSFRRWTKADNGLQYDYINDIFAAPDGLIWLFYWSGIGENGFVKGIDILDPETGKVQPLEQRIAAKLPIARTRLAIGFAYDNDGTLYIGTQSPAGVLSYHPQRGFAHTDIGRPGTFYLQFCDGQRNLWGTYFEPGQNSYEAAQIGFQVATKRMLTPVTCSQFLPFYNQHHTFRQDFGYSLGREGNYPLFAYNPQGNTAVSPALGTGHSRFAAYLDTAKTLFVRDLQLWDMRRNELVLDLDHAFSMTDAALEYPQAWHIDRAGRLWIGTSFGLGVVEIRPNRFHRLLYTADPSGRAMSVRGILPIGKTLFVNTELKGQFQIDLATSAARRLPNAPLGVFLYGLGKDPAGNVYFTTHVGITLAQRTPEGMFREWEWWGGAAAWSLWFVDATHFWAGTMAENGLHAGDLSRPDIRDSVALNGFDELRKVPVYHIGPAADGSIWICTESGLYQADARRGVLKRFWSGGKGADYLPHDYFLHFYEDAQGIFWLSTSGSGLIRWDRKTGKYTRYGRKEGLPAETVYAAYEDSHAHLWIPSDYGIIQFDKQSGEVRHVYSTSEGITHREFNRIAHARGSDGTLYFGGMNGVTYFHPDDFYGKIENLRPPLEVVAFSKYDGESGEMVNVMDEWRQHKRIELQPNDRYCILDLALLAFTETKQIHYAYRMDDETIWTYQTDRQLRLSGMAYGTHTVHIKAQAANGTWAANELTLTIEQLAPLYLRGWFIALVLLLAVAGVFLFVRMRTASLLQRQREVEAEIKAATAEIAQQADEIRQLSAMKSRFFANVSHELRTPLTLMLGPLSASLKRQIADPTLQRNLQTAYANARQLLRLVNEILDLSKMEAGKMTLRPSSVSLQPFLQNLVNAFEAHAHESHLGLHLDYRIDRPVTLGMDVDKVTKILNNLLSNALKFTPAGGSVTVRVEETAAEVQISVQDTGRGIHPDDVPRIFDRFYQTGQADAPVEGGTGIGLALSQEFALLMQGNISVRSELGVGSTFVFAFPRQEMPAEETNSISEPILIPQNTDSQPIASKEEAPLLLLTEDNPGLREYVSQVLSPFYRVQTAEHGRAALDWLAGATEQPALILSDIMMPVMDGFQFLEALKGDDRYRHLPVVMLTARADIQDKLRALRIGVDDYLLKPFEEEELLVRVANLLRNYQLRQVPASIAGEESGDETDSLPDSGASLPQGISQEDANWLAAFEARVKARLSEPALTADDLANDMAMSRNPFFRQVKRLTGLTPAQYLTEARYHQARVLLETRAVSSVKASALSVGLMQVEHFARTFQQRFGKYPSEYLGE